MFGSSSSFKKRVDTCILYFDSFFPSFLLSFNSPRKQKLWLYKTINICTRDIQLFEFPPDIIDQILRHQTFSNSNCYSNTQLIYMCIQVVQKRLNFNVIIPHCTLHVFLFKIKYEHLSGY